MKFVTLDQAKKYIAGKSVALIGSAPTVLQNEPGFIDNFNVVVRVNNYKLGECQGHHCDVHYSFYGSSIRKRKENLIEDGVRLCLCKCPDAQPIESAWHVDHNKKNGIDYRYIYEARKDWWFCDTYIPTVEAFMEKFRLLDKHVPTTGFSAILDVLACEPSELFLTGFDFFSSGIHNVDEKWVQLNPGDPIGHRPDAELTWLMKNMDKYPITVDKALKKIFDLQHKRFGT